MRITVQTAEQMTEQPTEQANRAVTTIALQAPKTLASQFAYGTVAA
jgi:hypothetical protein